MSTSYRTTLATLVAIALLTSTALPALAAPGTPAGDNPDADAGLNPLAGLWHRLIAPIASVFQGRPGHESTADGPSSVFEHIGAGADPTGTPSSDGEDASSTSDVTYPATDDPTG